MQVIDWIHRNEWTDYPPCVHPTIRAMAINFNDSAFYEERQQLLDLAPRIMGTQTKDQKVHRQLATFVIENLLDEEEKTNHRFHPRPKYWNNDALHYVGSYAPCDLHSLMEVLDEFDRITGRTADPEPIDWAPICQAMEVEVALT